MTLAFVAVGSNIDPAGNVLAALRRLAGLVRLVGVSTVYQTTPEGRPEQPPYYNCVVAIETELPPERFKHEVLRKVETDLGRVRTADRYAARTIDLDLVVYGTLCLDTADLTLPDPVIFRRPYLAGGLRELAGALSLPLDSLHLAQLPAAPTQDRLHPLVDYTQRVRKELGLGNIQ